MRLGLLHESRIRTVALGTIVVFLCLMPVPTHGGDPEFLRGDADGSAVVFSLLDALHTLEYLIGLQDVTCLDAADANDDGSVNIVDPVSILAWAFNGALPPPDPGPDECGTDPTDDDLGCETYDGC